MTDLDARYHRRADYAAGGGYRDRRDRDTGDYRDYRDYGDYRDDGAYQDGDYDDYDDYDDYEGDLVDRRWRGVALTAGVVLVAAVITTAVILTGGGDGGTAGTVSAPPTRTVIATPPATSSPAASLPAETVSTVPSSSPRPTSSPATPTTSPARPSPSTAAAPVVDPYTVTYTVTGTKSLLDLVTIVYTDEQGFPHTDVNPALPWTRRVVLNPGVTVRSVAATSLRSKLNCTITDAAGQPIATAANNSIIATCTR